MTVAAYLSLLGVWIAAITAPGPDTVQLIRLGSRSRRAALWAAVGICTGNVLWPVVTMAGLAALIAAFPWILATLYIGGGAFLFRMGVLAFRGGLRDYRRRSSVFSDANPSSFSNRRDDPEANDMDAWRAWRLGLATNLSNPKALLFFGAVFAQFIPAGAGLRERIAVIAMMTAVGLGWFCGFAWAVSLPVWVKRLQRANPVIEMVAGVIFALLGAVLLIEGLREVL